MDESNQKPTNRRRTTPKYEDNETTVTAIRDPFTALIEAEEKQRIESTDIKTILKQNSGELSLSEILQKKNLSLTELLRGNPQAIRALSHIETTPKYARLPPSLGLLPRKDLEMRQNYQNDQPDLTSDEVLEAQRKRLSLLHGNKATKYPEIVNLDVVTEESTEKRIFVPSTQIYSETTTTKALPLSNAKINKIITPIVPPRAIPIKVHEIFGLQNEIITTQGPFKMKIDIDITTNEPIIEDKTIVPPNKLKNVTAKEEIMEIMKNPIEKERLSKILKLRNMTVEELVKQRERGSSQLHLADIFHKKTLEPEPKEEPHVGHIIIEKTARKPKNTLVTLKPEDFYTITSFPTVKIETIQSTTKPPFLPIWEEIYSGIFNSKDEVKYTTEEMVDLNRLEEIDQHLVDLSDDRLNLNDDEDFITLPTGVKSAILASLAIVGLSLIVFLTILVIFKWSQRQKRKLNYSGSFSGSRIKSPILEPVTQTRTFRSFVSETLGRKKPYSYYKSSMQSMSDSIWDSEKKSYMI